MEIRNVPRMQLWSTWAWWPSPIAAAKKAPYIATVWVPGRSARLCGLRSAGSRGIVLTDGSLFVDGDPEPTVQAFMKNIAAMGMHMFVERGFDRHVCDEHR